MKTHSKAFVHRHLGIGLPTVDRDGNPVEYPSKFRIRLEAGDQTWNPAGDEYHVAPTAQLATYERHSGGLLMLTVEARE